MNKHINIISVAILSIALLSSCTFFYDYKLRQELARKDKIIDSLTRKKSGEFFFSFDKIGAIVRLEHENIKLGDSIKANVYLTAFNSKEKPFEVYTCDNLDTITGEMTGNIDTIRVKYGEGTIKIKPKKKGKNYVQGVLIIDINDPPYTAQKMFFMREYNVY
jgi:hypothetical protein